MNWIQIKTNLSRRFPTDVRYLIGVSGGRDSLALLHWLLNAGYARLILCHLNHTLRGRSSDADARFVQEISKKYQLEFELGAADIRASAKEKKASIETAARDARYSFFAKVAKRRRCPTIFLAHHADDLVETFLINLFRGTGSTGLGAIREISTRQIDDVELTIVRPFLSIWRKEINRYVREHRVRFREDASNKNLNPLRNRIRHRAIPYLEKILDREIRQNVWRTAMVIAEEEHCFNHQLPEPTGAELSVSRLRSLPTALQRRTILKWLRAQKISDIGYDVIERIRSMLDQDAQIAKVNLARDRHARRRAGKIFLE